MIYCFFKYHSVMGDNQVFLLERLKKQEVSLKDLDV